LRPTSASATDARCETAAAGAKATATDTAPSDAATAAAEGVRDGPSPLEPAYAPATDARREAAAAAGRGWNMENWYGGVFPVAEIMDHINAYSCA
jgi:hypothetical protein